MANEKKCEICGKSFKRPIIKQAYTHKKVLMQEFNWNSKKYCSNICLVESQRNVKKWSKKQKCLECGKEFIKTQARPTKKYCSPKCSRRFNQRNKKYSERYIRYRQKELAKKYKISLKKYLELTKKCKLCPIDKCIGLHHIVPLKKGGKNKIENYMPLCWNCHKYIHSGLTEKDIKEYYKEKWRN